MRPAALVGILVPHWIESLRAGSQARVFAVATDASFFEVPFHAGAPSRVVAGRSPAGWLRPFDATSPGRGRLGVPSGEARVSESTRAEPAADPAPEPAAEPAGAALAVIPARGGSKRIPGKNIRQLGGRPAIAYTIDAALASGVFARVVVSTDSDEIADVALRYGAEVPFMRDPSLADDHTPVSLVTVDALERLDPRGTAFRYVAQLMPNCPLRNADDVRDSFAQYTRSGSVAQLSVTRFGWLNPWWAMTRDASLVLHPLFEREATMRSQDLPELYCPTGAIWWATAGTLRLERTFHVAGRTGWELPWWRALDIDTMDDWRMAELLLERPALAVPGAGGSEHD